MTIQAAANATISIGTTAVHSNQTEYEADTYTEIEQVESVGAFGDNFAEVTFTGLSDGRVQKKKGSANAGNVTITCAFDVTAHGSPLGGQGILNAAAEDTGSSDYNFKVVFNDLQGSPEGATTRYFSGQVASFEESLDGADTIVMVSSEVRINTAILKVAAG